MIEAPVPCPHCGYFQSSAPCSVCGDEVLDGPRGRPIRPGRRLPPVEMLQGFVTFYAAGIHLLTRPEYFGRLGIPVASNLLAAAVVAALAFYGIHGSMVWLVAREWGVLDVIRDPVAWTNDTFALVLTAVVVVFVGPAVIQTLTVPFVDPLADAVEKMVGGPGLCAVERSPWRSLRVNVRASAQVLAMQIAVLVPCLLLSFCQLGLLLALLVAAFLGALLWFEIPFARRGYTIEQRIRIVRHNWARALGFGIALQLGLCIPFFNILLLGPTAAVAVTMTYLHFEKVPPRGIVRPPPGAARPADETVKDA